MKDPFCYENEAGDFFLGFCTHPFTWSSSNSAYIMMKKGAETFTSPVLNWFPRGPAWDVAITRPTCIIDVPRIGNFLSIPEISLICYDGGECMRNLQQHTSAAHRPRGYSCEELGGAGYFLQGIPESCFRLSRLHPLFTSPWHHTGTSRYVSILAARNGWYTLWQQASSTGSQPLVMHLTDYPTLHTILSH